MDWKTSIFSSDHYLRHIQKPCRKKNPQLGLENWMFPMKKGLHFWGIPSLWANSCDWFVV
jgi:hypothetical protein